MISVRGFSTQQIVLDKQIDKPLAELPQKETVIDYLPVLNATRKFFTAGESSKKLKVVLQRKIC